jgi:hypothetical protein
VRVGVALRLLFGSLVTTAFFASVALAADAGSEVSLPVHRWRVIERESGPVNYYTVHTKASPPHIRAHYRSPLETTVLGFPLVESDRNRATKLRWRWRAIKLPAGANECSSGKGDSAAVIYVTWRRTLRWYTLKYVWSASAKPGTVCARKRTPFVAQDVIVLRSGLPLDTWQAESVDLRAAFRKHFADGDPEADIPEMIGVALMTDGDQTRSESIADYADFVLTR